MVHLHSLEAHASESASGKLKTREQAILGILATGNEKGWTDREIMMFLGFYEMNAVRPRITSLVAKRLVEECGSTTCLYTGKRVRLVRLKQGQQRLF